jgi:hypothetical protein
MLYKTNDGKHVELLRVNFKDDTAYYMAILKAKGYQVQKKAE